MYETVRTEMQLAVQKDGVNRIDESEEVIKRLLRLVQITSNPKLIDEKYDQICAKELLLDKRLQTMVNDYVPQGEILDDLVCFFSIFSDYTRLKMISALAISEMCVSDISLLLKLNQTTVSHQLRLLKNLNAVKTRRQGKVVFYSLRNETLNEVLLKGVEFLGY
jgi:ArsR family transcriptional regulator